MRELHQFLNRHDRCQSHPKFQASCKDGFFCLPCQERIDLVAEFIRFNRKPVTSKQTVVVVLPLLPGEPSIINGSLLFHPRNQFLKLLPDHRSSHMAVFCRMHDRDPATPNLREGAITLVVITLDCCGSHALQHGPGHRRLGGNINKHALARGPHARMPDKCRNRGFGACMPPYLGYADSYRRPV